MSNTRFQIVDRVPPQEIETLGEEDLQFLQEKVPVLYYINSFTRNTFDEFLRELYATQKK